MITPYENATGGDPRFMHFYEMDTDDPEQAFKRMTPLVMDRIGGADTDAFHDERGHALERTFRVVSVHLVDVGGDRRRPCPRA